MFARLLAAFCLINPVLLIGAGSSKDQPDAELVVYLTGEWQPGRILDYMKLESGRLFAAAGYRMNWSDVMQAERPSTEGALIVVRLSGGCDAAPASAARSDSMTPHAPLASTAVSAGQILPFISIDCAGLKKFISGPLIAETPSRRAFLYGRAIGRLLGHELYHVLLKTGMHAREGVARPGFTANDLLTEHFEFESESLARLRALHPSAGASLNVEAFLRP